jgi:hypothetical protein
MDYRWDLALASEYCQGGGTLFVSFSYEQFIRTKTYLFQSQSVNWGVNSRLTDKEVMVDDRNVILGELYIC